MRRRLGFWWAAAVIGWQWLWAIAGWVSRALFLLALLLGVSIVGFNVLKWGGWVVVAAVVAVLLLVVLGEGAYRAWDVTERQLAAVATPQEPPPMVEHAAELAAAFRARLAENVDDFEPLRASLRPLNNRMLGSGHMRTALQQAMVNAHRWRRGDAERIADELEDFSRTGR